MIVITLFRFPVLLDWVDIKANIQRNARRISGIFGERMLRIANYRGSWVVWAIGSFWIIGTYDDFKNKILARCVFKNKVELFVYSL